MLAEKALYTGGATRRLIFKPMVELVSLKNLLPPNIRINIRVHFNDQAFFMNGTVASRLTAADINMKLQVTSLRFKAPLYNTLETVREKGSYVQFPVVRYETRTFTMPDGETTFDKADMFEQRIPNRLWVGFQDTRSFNGTLAYDPFSFEKFGLMWIKQLINGEEYPEHENSGVKP